MKNIIFVMLLCFSIFSHAGAAKAEGGMSECVSLAVQAALDSYAASHRMNAVPAVKVGPAGGSPSNGIDVSVSVNGEVTYKVISTPTPGSIRTLRGCTDARVTSTETNY